MDYKFERFSEPAFRNKTGFGYPVDVYWRTTNLGTLEAKADGFRIHWVRGPMGLITIKDTPNNKFKTEEIAAKRLHQVWAMERKGKSQEEPDDGEKWKK